MNPKDCSLENFGDGSRPPKQPLVWQVSTSQRFCKATGFGFMIHFFYGQRNVEHSTWESLQNEWNEKIHWPIFEMVYQLVQISTTRQRHSSIFWGELLYHLFRCYNWNSYWTQPLCDDIRDNFVDITGQFLWILQKKYTYGYSYQT